MPESLQPGNAHSSAHTSSHKHFERHRALILSWFHTAFPFYASTIVLWSISPNNVNEWNSARVQCVEGRKAQLLHWIVSSCQMKHCPSMESVTSSLLAWVTPKRTHRRAFITPVIWAQALKLLSSQWGQRHLQGWLILSKFWRLRYKTRLSVF